MRNHEPPLERLGSLKRKVSAVIVSAVAITVVVFWAGIRLGVWPSLSGVVAALVALGFARWLARGLTSPLREMTSAAAAFAGGDFSRRVAVSSRDEIGTLARTLNQMAAELDATDRMRRDLVANVSHELRTPISALRARLENLVDGVEPVDADALRAALEEVERLGRLVQQLLDLSRLESGTLPLDRRAFEVESMLRQAVRDAARSSRDVDIRVAVAPDGLLLDADPERLHQVVANLVENAVRHSPRGATVSVLARETAQGARLEVSDEGPGIAEGESERVFERFYRADTARSSRDGGAGLGLAIARWIVDLHGGAIRAERREPHGCRIVVDLPGATARAHQLV